MHRGPRAEAPVVDVAAEHPWRDAAHAAVRSDAHHAEVWSDGHGDVTAERLPCRRIRRRHDARYVVQRERREVEPEHRTRRRRETVGGRVDQFVDGDPFLAEPLVEEPPVGSTVRPVGQARPHLQDLDPEGVAGSGTDDVDRPRHDVHARPTIGLGDPGPDRLDAIVHQEIGSVAGMVCHCLDPEFGAGCDGERRRDVRVEVAPETGVRIGHDVSGVDVSGVEMRWFHSGLTVGPKHERSISNASRSPKHEHRRPRSLSPGRATGPMLGS